MSIIGGANGQVIDLAASKRRRVLRWAVFTFTVVAFLVLGFFLSDVTNPFLLGLLVAYVLNPVVEGLEGRGISRHKAVTALFGLVLAVMTAVLGLGLFRVATHAEEVGRSLMGERVLDPTDPQDLELIRGQQQTDESAVPLDLATQRVSLENGLYFLDRDGNGIRKPGLAELVATSLHAQLGAAFTQSELEQAARAIRSHATSITKASSAIGRGLRGSLSRVSVFLSYLLLVPVYTFFLLNSFSSLRDTVRDHLPGAYRARVVEISSQIDSQVAAFFRGRLILALLKGVVTWLGLWIVGVPFSFFVGMGAGVLSIIPFLGPLCGGALAIVLAYEPGGWLLRVGAVLIVFAVAEVVEAVTQPLILGREVGLSPLSLILSFFVFGQLFGLFGVLLAVPIACVTKILFKELVLPEIQALAREPGPRLQEVPGPSAEELG